MSEVAVGLSGHKPHVAQDGSHADGRAPSVVVHGQMSHLHRVAQGVTIVAPHINVDVADGPLALGHLRDVVSLLEAQLHMAGHLQGIGKVRGVA